MGIHDLIVFDYLLEKEHAEFLKEEKQKENCRYLESCQNLSLLQNVGLAPGEWCLKDGRKVFLNGQDYIDVKNASRIREPIFDNNYIQILGWRDITDECFKEVEDAAKEPLEKRIKELEKENKRLKKELKNFAKQKS